MIIKSVKFYQGVKFGSDTITFINMDTENDKQVRLGASKISVEEVPHGILLRKDNLAVLGTWNNVAFVEYDSSSAKNIHTKKSESVSSK